MKTLIISDLHLNTCFDESLYDYIVNLLDRVDQVIINGDFWDYYLCSFEEFINSEWSGIFPLLKEKNALYIYGNHDRSMFSDDRVTLFSDQQLDEYTLHSGRKKIVIEHGHRVAPEMDDQHPTLTRLFNRFYPRFYFYMLKDLPITRFINRKIMSPQRERIDESMQKYVAESKTREVDAFVFGHSHVFDNIHTPGYFNSGSFWGGIAEYLIVEDGIISPIIEHYW
ncbi:MAG: metallophosphoesterase family protein [Pseudomonadales bacterium]|nr:metallophosphoesterase family protein [Candidatus Woesebacteria bacterium]MCB9800676.1 metallophosphoesterase family protein [Pseudomonadales bacterium]